MRKEYENFNLNPDSYAITYIGENQEPLEYKKGGRELDHLFVQIRMHYNESLMAQNGRYGKRNLALTTEIVNWCKSTYGIDNFGFVQTGNGLWVLLRDMSDATIFKLAWSNG